MQTLQELIKKAAERARSGIKRALRKRNPIALRQTVADSNKEASRLQAFFVQATNPALDCKKGCSHCCYTSITPAAIEILVIADMLKQRLTKAELRKLIEHCREQALRLHGLTAAEAKDVRMPCVLLNANGACGIYDQRPMICRAWNSLDVRACIAQKEKPRSQPVPLNKGFFELPLFILGAELKAMREYDRDNDTMISLPEGLLAALGHPNTTTDWLRGEDVFADARSMENVT